MLSFEKLKDFLILIFTFAIIYWFQQVDDKKRCKKRDNIYDTIKLPLLVTSIVGLILFWEKKNILAIFVQPLQNPVPTVYNSGPITNPLPPVYNNTLPNNLNSQLGGGELNVFTELPEW